MKSPLKNEQGAILIIELLVLAVVLTAAGFAAYEYSIHRKAASQATTPKPHVVTKASLSPTPSPDPTAGWKTCTSAYEQASFKYPRSWKMEQKQAIDPSADDYEVILTSPLGLEVDYWDLVDGLGGSCGSSPLHYQFSSVQPLSDIDTQGKELVYLVQSPAGIALTGKDSWSNGQPGGLEVGSCGAYLTINSKLHNDKGAIAFGTTFFMGNATHALPDSQAQDLPTAKLILQSFRY